MLLVSRLNTTQENSMFVARRQIDARFGHKQAVIDLMHRWLKKIGAKAGTDKMDVKLLTGSVGAREATEPRVIHALERASNLNELRFGFDPPDGDRELQSLLDRLRFGKPCRILGQNDCERRATMDRKAQHLQFSLG